MELAKALASNYVHGRCPIDASFSQSSIKYFFTTQANFLFLNLWKQFKRPANCYFLFISCLQCVRAVSITGGIPTTLLPLLFVLTVTALKDAVEDFNRHRADDTENNRTTHVVTKAEVHHARSVPWREVKVGDVLLVKVRRSGMGVGGVVGGRWCGWRERRLTPAITAIPTHAHRTAS